MFNARFLGPARNGAIRRRFHGSKIADCETPLVPGRSARVVPLPRTPPRSGLFALRGPFPLPLDRGLEAGLERRVRHPAERAAGLLDVHDPTPDVVDVAPVRVLRGEVDADDP